MRDFIIEDGVVIDDIDIVTESLAMISGMTPAAETIRKFVTTEKNTRFYIDRKCSCKMQPDGSQVYLWLDSGCVDYSGNPIFISLLKTGSCYTGHYVGTMDVLSRSAREYFRISTRDANKNISALRSKYRSKAQERNHSHIGNEQEYLLDICNPVEEETTIGSLLKGIAVFSAEAEPVIVEMEQEVQEDPQSGLDEIEEEITVGLLADKIDSMQDYIDELLEEIRKFKSEDQAKIQELEAKNEEYQKAFKEMRMFLANESNAEDENAEENGHSLLGRDGRILVLGETAMNTSVMLGIAKQLGFEKNDFEFETDYHKVKSFAGRLSGKAKYTAIILGAVPHKVAGLEDYSSLVQKCKAMGCDTITVDARTKSGELKVTKDSYREALFEIVSALKMKMAG